MNKTHTVVIRTEFDVFIARRHVRELARAAGLDLANQARIALATSSLARALGLGEVYQGQVSIDCLRARESEGVRVICTAIEGANGKLAAGIFTDTGGLVDELTVERIPSRDLRATAVKWAVRERGSEKFENVAERSEK